MVRWVTTSQGLRYTGAFIAWRDGDILAVIDFWGPFPAYVSTEQRDADFARYAAIQRDKLRAGFGQSPPPMMSRGVLTEQQLQTLTLTIEEIGAGFVPNDAVIFAAGAADSESGVPMFQRDVVRVHPRREIVQILLFENDLTDPIVPREEFE